MAASEDDVEFSVNANLAGLLASLQRAGELANKWADQMTAAAKAAKDAAEASASQMMKTHADLARSYEQTASRAERAAEREAKAAERAAKAVAREREKAAKDLARQQEQAQKEAAKAEQNAQREAAAAEKANTRDLLAKAKAARDAERQASQARVARNMAIGQVSVGLINDFNAAASGEKIGADMVGGIVGQLAGGALGMFFGGPAGTMLGSQLGEAIGKAAGPAAVKVMNDSWAETFGKWLLEHNAPGDVGGLKAEETWSHKNDAIVAREKKKIEDAAESIKKAQEEANQKIEKEYSDELHKLWKLQDTLRKAVAEDAAAKEIKETEDKIGRIKEALSNIKTDVMVHFDRGQFVGKSVLEGSQDNVSMMQTARTRSLQIGQKGDELAQQMMDREKARLTAELEETKKQLETEKSDRKFKEEELLRQLIDKQQENVNKTKDIRDAITAFANFLKAK